MNMKLMSSKEAISLINEGDTFITSGFVCSILPGELLLEIEKSFLETGKPNNLTAISAAGIGDPLNIEKSGFNCIAHEGLLKRVIMGHFADNYKVVNMINKNQIEAYNLPQGIIGKLMRNIAEGKDGLLTKIGLGTYVDPDYGGAKLNNITKEDIVFKENFRNEEYLFYKAPPINVALIRGTAADELGNISFEDEVLLSTARYAAMAAKACGGKVIVQVRDYVSFGSIPPRDVGIAGIFVDAVVLTENKELYHKQTGKNFYNPALNGKVRVPLESITHLPLNERKIVARRAAMEVNSNSVVNLGIGMPECVSGIMAEESCADQIILTIEAGGIGGIPTSGDDFGATLNAWAFVDEITQFDFYHGGGLDITYLGFAEVSGNGNVNSSKFGEKITGCGGFIDISQSAKKIVFSGTFTSGGLRTSIENGKLKILKEGRARKFIKKVSHLTFNGDRSFKNGQDILFVTERAVFKLTENGLELIEIAPGIDLKNDILQNMDFKPIISENLKVMDERIFVNNIMGLKSKFHN